MPIELIHGDCMDYMRECEDDAFDLAIVDPPYGRGEHGGTKRNHGVVQKNGSIIECRDGGYIKKDWDYSCADSATIKEIQRVSVNQIIWGVNYIDTLFPGGRIIWDKINDGSDQSAAEIAYCSLNQRVDMVRYMWRGMMQGEGIGSTRQQGNKSLNEKRIHPTQKPVKLYDWLLTNYAEPGQKILDTHLGSGSSAIAAHYFGVDFVGIEIDEDYYKAACERFERETAQIDLFARGIT